MAGEADTFLLFILAFIFPPAAVAVLTGCGADLCINFFLTLLAWFPGCIHAFWLIIKRTEANESYGYKNWTYTGMGEYRPGPGATPKAPYPGAYGEPAPPPQPPPPPGPPPPQGQHPAGDVPQSSQAPVDQNGGQGPPAPDQKLAPPPVPADDKQTGPTAPPSGT